MTGAAIAGRVKDATGAALPQAEVIITNVETGFKRSTFSDESGRYIVSLLPVRLYEIRADKAGFQNELTTGIQLEMGRSAVIDL
jgi:Carboxypeptidase regulatory-like domain